MIFIFIQFNVNPQAAMVLERAGINPELVLSNRSSSMADEKLENVTYCNIGLPFPKPMASEDTPVDKRLFVVCQPAAVPERILRDAFSRFGNLIDVYLLSGMMYTGLLNVDKHTKDMLIYAF